MNLGLKIDSDNENLQVSKLKSYRASRDNTLVTKKLNDLKIVCQGNDNVMPPLIDALKSGATVGEVNGVMRDVFGTWISPSGV
jgi:methylmalonyl-CoA mutase N-terminal domain/subunit